jgi:hypothetical protein
MFCLVENGKITVPLAGSGDSGQNAQHVVQFLLEPTIKLSMFLLSYNYINEFMVFLSETKSEGLYCVYICVRYYFVNRSDVNENAFIEVEFIYFI